MKNLVTNPANILQLDSVEIGTTSCIFSIVISRKPVVTIYSRPGCHLCDEAKRAISESGCEGEYFLEEINIDDDPKLTDLYRNDIPVVLIDGVKVFKHRVDPRDFKRKLYRLGFGG
jgi:glutaredoxin